MKITAVIAFSLLVIIGLTALALVEGLRQKIVHFESIRRPKLALKGHVTSDECNFRGNYLTWYWATEEACPEYCEWYGASCTHYVFNRDEGVCYLKQGRVGKNNLYLFLRKIIRVIILFSLLLLI